MPGAQLGIDELDQLTRAADEEMGRNPQMVDARIVGMLLRVEGVGEKLGDAGTAEAVGGETDGVDDDQANIATFRTLVTILRGQGNRSTHELNSLADISYSNLRQNWKSPEALAIRGIHCIRFEIFRYQQIGGVAVVQEPPLVHVIVEPVAVGSRV